MHSEMGGRRRMAVLAATLMTALVLAACGSAASSGSGGSNAQSLLRQTFSNNHTVKSGVLGFKLTLTPSGSSLLSTPVVLSLSGPFASHGPGHLPSSDFTIQIAALGKRGALGVISTGTAGYVTMQGAAYQLPQTQFQNLEKGFSSAASGSGNPGGLAGLGINPEHWLQNPSVVGTQAVDGTQTTHIRAGVNASALLSDLNTFLTRTTKGGAGSAISSATQQKIAAAVRNATVDIWTGTSDKVLRRLTLTMTIPVSGQTSAALGGLTSAGVSLTIQYADINQPQTVTAPAHVLPYSQFQTKLRSALGALAGGLAGTTGGLAGSGASAPSASVNRYSHCIQSAGQSVARMQKCAALLHSGG